MKKFAIIAGSVLGVLVLVVALMFAFGRPQSVPAKAVVTESSADSTAASQQAAPEEAAPSGPLAIEIPGCVCHSNDPKLVEEHSKYRMSQCAGCHNGGVPTGAR